MNDILGIIGIFFVPVLAPFIFVGVIVWFKSRENRKRMELQADLCAKALEHGRELPADLFRNPARKKANPLNTGIILISVGVGVSLFMWLISPAGGINHAAALGLVPFCLGIGYLIIHFLNRKRGGTDEK